VSNDNAFSESLFRTVKYCPAWPSQGFATLEEARAWVLAFVDWHNNRHCHSALKFVTPAQRHRGDDRVNSVSGSTSRPKRGIRSDGQAGPGTGKRQGQPPSTRSGNSKRPKNGKGDNYLEKHRRGCSGNWSMRCLWRKPVVVAA
jgi:putative transposase